MADEQVSNTDENTIESGDTVPEGHVLPAKVAEILNGPDGYGSQHDARAQDRIKLSEARAAQKTNPETNTP